MARLQETVTKGDGRAVALTRLPPCRTVYATGVYRCLSQHGAGAADAELKNAMFRLASLRKRLLLTLEARCDRDSSRASLSGGADGSRPSTKLPI